MRLSDDDAGTVGRNGSTAVNGAPKHVLDAGVLRDLGFASWLLVGSC
jgi:hypothetical protein